MSITVGEVIDRTLSEFIYAGGANMPAFDTLAAQLTAGAATMTVSGLQTYFPQGVVEIGSELIFTKEAETTTTVDLNERGFLGTTDATHASGTKVWLDPPFYRITIFNAIKSIIGTLYPAIYKRVLDTTETVDTTNVVALASAAKRVLSLRFKHGTRWYKLTPGKDYEVLQDASPIEVQFYGGVPSAATRIVYASDFTLPTSESDDLNSVCGVPVGLEPYFPMAVAGYLLQGKELPRVQIEEIRSLLAAQGVQVGAALNVGQLLLQTFRRNYVEQERMRLFEQDRMPVEVIS